MGGDTTDVIAEGGAGGHIIGVLEIMKYCRISRGWISTE